MHVRTSSPPLLRVPFSPSLSLSLSASLSVRSSDHPPRAVSNHISLRVTLPSPLFLSSLLAANLLRRLPISRVTPLSVTMLPHRARAASLLRLRSSVLRGLALHKPSQPRAGTYYAACAVARASVSLSLSLRPSADSRDASAHLIRFAHSRPRTDAPRSCPSLLA